MYCVFIFIILIFNYLHRLQSIISEIFVLVALVITILYSPAHLFVDSKFFTRIFSVRNYLLNNFSDKNSGQLLLENVFSDDFYLRNYFLYQKNKIKATVYIYNVSVFSSTFTEILSDNSVVNSQEIHTLLNQYPILRNLKFGQIISLTIVKDRHLQSVLWKISPTESRIYNRVDTCNDSFTENVIVRFNESNRWYYTMIIGRLHDNFINSVRSLGLDDGNTQIIINALEWQINFQKLHRGDQFSILSICSRSINNKDSKINNRLVVVAVRLHTMGKDYYAFRADNGRFYNRDAIGMGGSFIPYPTIKPFRISSNFSLKRLNPITGRISPHFGVDFAVPIGTPVLSVGDGKVIISKYGDTSGNYIVIRHSPYCITRYMHLNSVLVKAGQVVKKGENIAFSGNTGRSTGPHLHFEVWINKKPVNPLTATFLYMERLNGYDRVNYIKKVATILPYLHFY